MGRRLTDTERRERNRAKYDEKERKEILRDSKRRERANNNYENASSIGRRMLDETPDQRAARKYRRDHLRKEWMFAKQAKNHKVLLEERRSARRAQMIGHGYEEDDDGISTEDTQTETRSTPRKRLLARDLLKGCEAVVA